MGQDNIQIAVRVRPFAPHEEGQTNIVKMDSKIYIFPYLYFPIL